MTTKARNNEEQGIIRIFLFSEGPVGYSSQYYVLREHQTYYLERLLDIYNGSLIYYMEQVLQRLHGFYITVAPQKALLQARKGYVLCVSWEIYIMTCRDNRAKHSRNKKRADL